MKSPTLPIAPLPSDAADASPGAGTTDEGRAPDSAASYFLRAALLARTSRLRLKR